VKTDVNVTMFFCMMDCYLFRNRHFEKLFSKNISNFFVIQSETVNEILQMMGLRVKKEALDAIIAEVDEDGKTCRTQGCQHFLGTAYQNGFISGVQSLT
jgi:Ca2+-binding EF-hand superfamily protein